MSFYLRDRMMKIVKCVFEIDDFQKCINPLSANSTKWSNKLVGFCRSLSLVSNGTIVRGSPHHKHPQHQP